MSRAPCKLDKLVAKKLKAMRGDLSQVQFSKKLGIAQSTLNRIENLEASPTLYLLDQICARLKLEVVDLITEKN